MSSKVEVLAANKFFEDKILKSYIDSIVNYDNNIIIELSKTNVLKSSIDEINKIYDKLITANDVKDIKNKRLVEYLDDHIPVKVDRTDKQYKYFPTTIQIINKYRGHYMDTGKKARKYANQCWKVYDVVTEEIYYLMFIEPEYVTKLCEKGFEYIYNNPDMCYLTWYHSQTGYVATHPNKQKNDIQFKYLHQVLLEHFQPEHLENYSVDHINNTEKNKDCSKLDNRLSNLRWASQSDQNKNRPKVARHENACELPDDIKNLPLPKYVTWNDGTGNKDPRQFYRIEGHPMLNGGTSSSTKSSKKTRPEKYADIMDKLHKLDAGVDPKDLLIKRKYPVGIRYDENKGSFVLDWRNRATGKRLNLKLRGDEDDEDIYEKFKIEVCKKYEDFRFE